MPNERPLPQILRSSVRTQSQLARTSLRLLESKSQLQMKLDRLPTKSLLQKKIKPAAEKVLDPDVLHLKWKKVVSVRQPQKALNLTMMNVQS